MALPYPCLTRDYTGSRIIRRLRRLSLYGTAGLSRSVDHSGLSLLLRGWAGHVSGGFRVPGQMLRGRFGDRKRDRHGLALKELRETTEAVQQDAFALLPRERRRVATLDWDSSIHEVYGNKKEGADWAYNNTWSYSGLYGTLAETGDLLYLGLREGYRHTSYGMKEVLPGTIERVGKHFRELRMRADSGYYSQALVRICEDREVEYFIVAKQHRNLNALQVSWPSAGLPSTPFI